MALAAQLVHHTPPCDEFSFTQAKKIIHLGWYASSEKSLFDQNRTVDRSRLMNKLDLIEDEIQKQVLGTLGEMFAE